MVTEIKDTTKLLKKSKYIGSGKTAKCYLLSNDRVLKLYKNNYYSYILSKRHNIIENMEKLTYLNNDTYICPEEIIIKDDKLIGYIYKYIDGKLLSKCNINLKTIIDNYSLIERDTKKISENNFLLNDLHPKNIIFNDKFNFIDLDNGVFTDDSIDDIFEDNMNKINNMLIHYLFSLYYYYDIKFNNDNYNELYKDSIINDYTKIIDLLKYLIDDNYIKKNDTKRKSHKLIIANINDYKFSKIFK